MPQELSKETSLIQSSYTPSRTNMRARSLADSYITDMQLSLALRIRGRTGAILLF